MKYLGGKKDIVASIYSQWFRNNSRENDEGNVKNFLTGDKFW